MDLLPVWRTPYFLTVFSTERVTLRASSSSSQRLPPLVHAGRTGLLLGELLCAADLSEPEPRLVHYVGLDQLAGLADALRDEEDGPLGVFLASEYGILPGLKSSKLYLGEAVPNAIPARVLDEFRREDGARLAHFQQYLVPFGRTILQAADEGKRPAPTAAQREEVTAKLERARFTLAPTRLGKPTLLPANLEARVWLELFELFEGQPVLRRCQLCERPFVPRRPTERRCPMALRVRGTGLVIARCITAGKEFDAFVGADQELARKREYKRLHAALRRSQKRYGDEHPYTTATRRELEKWRELHGRRRGRRSPIDQTDIL